MRRLMAGLALAAITCLSLASGAAANSTFAVAASVQNVETIDQLNEYQLVAQAEAVDAMELRVSALELTPNRTVSMQVRQRHVSIEEGAPEVARPIGRIRTV